MRLLPGSAYHLATARYSFVEIRLDALTPAEAAAHVLRVREELALFGLLVDSGRSLPVPTQPVPANEVVVVSGTMTAVGPIVHPALAQYAASQAAAQPAPAAAEPDRAITSYTGTTADATIPPHTISGVGGLVATRNDAVLTPHQQELRAADAAAAAKGVPPPTIPGPPQRDTALQSAPAISWSQQPPSAKPSVKDPEAPSTELQRGKIRAMARKGENHRHLAEWLKNRGLVGIDALSKGDASTLIDHLVAQG